MDLTSAHPRAIDHGGSGMSAASKPQMISVKLSWRSCSAPVSHLQPPLLHSSALQHYQLRLCGISRQSASPSPPAHLRYSPSGRGWGLPAWQGIVRADEVEKILLAHVGAGAWIVVGAGSAGFRQETMQLVFSVDSRSGMECASGGQQMKDSPERQVRLVLPKS